MEDIVVGVKVDKSGAIKGVGGINNELRKIGKGVKPSTAGLTSYNNALKRVSVNSRTTMGSLGKLAKTFRASKMAILGWSTAILGVGYSLLKATKIAGDFEQSLASIKAIVQPTAEGMKQLTDEARRLGRSTQFTATQSANAMVEMGKLGLSSKQIMESTKDVLDLATASMSSLSRAGAGAVTTMNQFGLEASDMGHITDVMALSFSSSALDLTRFTGAMKMAGTLAHGVGVSLEQTTGYLSALAKAGLSGTMAGTGLMRMFQKLAEESGQVGKVLDFLGVKGKSMKEKMDALGHANLSAKNTMQLFGQIAGKSALALLGNIDYANKLADSYEKSDGSAKKMADTMRNNLPTAIKLMKSAFDDLIITITGQNFKDGMRNTVDGMSAMFTKASVWYVKSQKDANGLITTLNKIGKITKDISKSIVLNASLKLVLGTIGMLTKGAFQFINFFMLGLEGVIAILDEANVALAKTIVGLSKIPIAGKLINAEWADSNLEKSIKSANDSMGDWMKNTGSFLDTFRKHSEEQKKAGEETDKTTKEVTKQEKALNDLQKQIDLMLNGGGGSALSDKQKQFNAILSKANSSKANKPTETKQSITTEYAQTTSIGYELGASKSDMQKIVNYYRAKLNEIQKAEDDALKKRGDALVSFNNWRIQLLGTDEQKRINQIDQSEAKALSRLQQSYADGLILKEEYESEMGAIEEKYRIEREEKAKVNSEKRNSDMINSLTGYIGQAVGIVNQVAETQQQVKNREIDNYIKSEEAKINYLGITSKRKKQLEDKMNRQSEKIRKKAFEDNKKWAIGMALVNGALAMISAMATATSNYERIAMAAVVTGQTIATVASISAQEFADGGIVRRTNGYGVDKEDAKLTAGELVANNGNQENLVKAMRTGVNPYATTSNTNNDSRRQSVNFNIVNNINGDPSTETMNKVSDASYITKDNLYENLNELNVYDRLFEV